MPTFDFRCRKCETVFEFSRPFGSKTTPACPSCRSRSTEKLLGAPAVVFKGSGWYKTDSRSSSAPAKAPAKTDAPAPAADAPKADAPATAEKKAPPAKPKKAE